MFPKTTTPTYKPLLKLRRFLKDWQHVFLSNAQASELGTLWDKVYESKLLNFSDSALYF